MLVVQNLAENRGSPAEFVTGVSRKVMVWPHQDRQEPPSTSRNIGTHAKDQQQLW